MGTETGFKFRSQVQIDNYLLYQNAPVQVKLRPPIMDGMSNECSPNKALLKETTDKKNKIEYTCKFTSGDNIDTLVNNLIKNLDNCWTCKSCGVQKTHRYSLVNHVEAHIEGTAYACEVCKRLITTRHRLSRHMISIHPRSEDKVTKPSKRIPIALSHEEVRQSNAQLHTHNSGVKENKLTPENLLKLNEFYKVNHKPNGEQLLMVAKTMKLELESVQIWFRRKRFKMQEYAENKKKKKENSKKIRMSQNLKERKPATKFSPEVLEKLNLAYEAHVKPSEELAESLNLIPLVVKNWFNNKKHRDQKKIVHIE